MAALFWDSLLLLQCFYVMLFGDEHLFFFQPRCVTLLYGKSLLSFFHRLRLAKFIKQKI